MNDKKILIIVIITHLYSLNVTINTGLVEQKPWAGHLFLTYHDIHYGNEV